MDDFRRRDEVRASLRLLRFEPAAPRPGSAGHRAPRLVLVASQGRSDEPPPTAQRIAVSSFLALALLMGVSALSKAAATAMAGMEPRSVASLSERVRPHFGLGQ